MLVLIEKYDDIKPGPSSQTTSFTKEVTLNSLEPGFYDVHGPVIEVSEKNIWDETAEQVLQEHAELWETLAEL